LNIDEILCVSVNDAFVMKAFGEARKASGKVSMLADSNAEFTRKIGMEIDASDFGLGTRSQRYAMIINDGVVEVMQAEADFVDLGVTSADHMLDIAARA
jgi:peroxiredoxin